VVKMSEQKESQTYQVWVAKDKAQAVFDAVMEKIQQAKQAGNIYSASWTRSSTEKGNVE